MLTREDLLDWAASGPTWLQRIIASHLEAWSLLETQEADAAAMRLVLEKALVTQNEEQGPDLIALAMGMGAEPEESSVEISEVLKRGAGNEILEDFKLLKESHQELLGALELLQRGLGTKLTEGDQEQLRALCEGALKKVYSQ